MDMLILLHVLCPCLIMWWCTPLIDCDGVLLCTVSVPVPQVLRGIDLKREETSTDPWSAWERSSHHSVSACAMHVVMITLVFYIYN